MDFSTLDDSRDVRLSNSPASTPLIVDEPTSPVRSVHLDMEGGSHKQQERGLRTADFFEDTSSDGEADGASTRAVAGQAPTPTLGSSPRKCRSGSPQKVSYLDGDAAPSQCVSHRDEDQGLTPYATPTDLHAGAAAFLKLTQTPGISRMVLNEQLENRC